MANIALTNGERYTFAKQGTVTVITDSTDSAEAEKLINNNLTLSGSDSRRLLLNTSNSTLDAYVHFKTNAVSFSAGARGASDSFTISTGATLTAAASTTALRIPNLTNPKVHFDNGIVSSGSVSITGGTSPASGFINPALTITGSVIINNGTSYTSASLTYGSSSAFLIRQEYSEIAFGKSTGPEYALYIQGRHNDNSARDITLNPKGGKIAVGTLAPSSNQIFQVAGGIKCTGAVDISSDKRLKQDILPIENALNKILTLNGVTYNWNKEFDPDQNLDDGNHMGLLAQDVEKIIPQIVSTDTSKNQLKSLAYIELIPVLIEAIKEQQTQINELKNKLKDTPYG